MRVSSPSLGIPSYALWGAHQRIASIISAGSCLIRPGQIVFICCTFPCDFLIPSTFGNIVQLLQRWTQEWGEDWNSVKRKIRLLGITMQGKTSPKTWRWQQHAHWVTLVERGAIKNISTPWWFWDQLANQQAKVTQSYTAERWGSREANDPRTNLGHAEALKRALQLFDLGKTKESRQTFTRHLSEGKAMAYPWLRALILELRSR